MFLFHVSKFSEVGGEAESSAPSENVCFACSNAIVGIEHTLVPGSEQQEILLVAQALLSEYLL